MHKLKSQMLTRLPMRLKESQLLKNMQWLSLSSLTIWGGGSRLSPPFPFLISPSPSTYFFIVFFVFFLDFFQPYATTPSNFICPPGCCAPYLLQNVPTLASAYHLLHYGYCFWWLCFLFCMFRIRVFFF